MKRVVLVHWNRAEARERATRLRRAGVRVVILDTADPESLSEIQRTPPDAFVVDLGRLPSQGRDLAVHLRSRKATRHVPIVFVDGAVAKVARVQKLLPDAAFCGWSRIRGTLGKALKRPPRDPVTPGSLSGYVGTPLPRKLGIKADSAVALLGAPKDFERTLGALPDDVRLRRQARGTADVVVLFVRSLADLDRRHPAAVRTLAKGGRLWIVWPKKASGVPTNLTQTIVRRYGLDRELVDYKICAVDETWSGLCFARRPRR